MEKILIFAFLLVLTVAVTADSSSASSSSGSNSDGTGHTFTSTSHNGHGTFTSTGNVPPQNNVGNVEIPNRFGGPDNPAPVNPGPVNSGSGSYGPGNYGPGNYGPGNYGPGNYGPGNYGPGNYGPGNYGQGNYNPGQFGAFPNYGPNYGYFPPFNPQPLATPEQFNQALNQYLNSLQQQYEFNGIGGSFAHSTPGAMAYATSYLGPTHLYKQQQGYLNAWKQAQNNAYAANPNFAYASGAYGPNGIHQAAGINPQNPQSPNVNINTRFDDDNNSPTKPGFYGVSTSSFSSSANVNGVSSEKKGAVTTVNDNGKVTTYKVDS